MHPAGRDSWLGWRPPPALRSWCEPVRPLQLHAAGAAAQVHPAGRDSWLGWRPPPALRSWCEPVRPLQLHAAGAAAQVHPAGRDSWLGWRPPPAQQRQCQHVRQLSSLNRDAFCPMSTSKQGCSMGVTGPCHAGKEQVRHHASIVPCMILADAWPPLPRECSCSCPPALTDMPAADQLGQAQECHTSSAGTACPRG